MLHVHVLFQHPYHSQHRVQSYIITRTHASERILATAFLCRRNKKILQGKVRPQRGGDAPKKNQYPEADTARPPSLRILWYSKSFFVRAIIPHTAATAHTSRQTCSTEVSSNIETVTSAHVHAQDTERGVKRGFDSERQGSGGYDMYIRL